MSAAQEPLPPTSNEGQKTERSEGEKARTRQPLDLTLHPDEVPEVVRFVSEMRAKKAVESGGQFPRELALARGIVRDWVKVELRNLRDSIEDIELGAQSTGVLQTDVIELINRRLKNFE
jgi:hypothetical protein